MTRTLAGKTVIFTDASSGIGEAIAKKWSMNMRKSYWPQDG